MDNHGTRPQLSIIYCPLSIMDLFPVLALSVGALLAVFSLLACGTAAMGTGDIFLLPGFGLHLLFFRTTLRRPFEDHPVLNDFFDVAHNS